MDKTNLKPYSVGSRHSRVRDQALKLVCVNPCSDPLWSQLVHQEETDVFHSPSWLTVLARTYGFKIQAQLLLNALDEPIAGIQLCPIDDFRGNRLVTLPFSDYSDPIIRNLDQWNQLSVPIFKENAQFNIRCLHNKILLTDDRLKQVNQAKWHGINLQQDLGAIWESFDGSARRAIKKAQRSGLVVHITDRKDDLRKFFQLHLGIRKNKYRLLAQPYQFFENIWDLFLRKQKGALLLAEYKKQIIGGVLFLEWKDKLYYKFNASNPKFLSLRPNDLVIWEGIKYGKIQGLKLLDFGISDWEQ